MVCQLILYGIEYENGHTLTAQIFCVHVIYDHMPVNFVRIEYENGPMFIADIANKETIYWVIIVY